jgi:hypothetical protein
LTVLSIWLLVSNASASIFNLCAAVFSLPLPLPLPLMLMLLLLPPPPPLLLLLLPGTSARVWSSATFVSSTSPAR